VAGSRRDTAKQSRKEMTPPGYQSRPREFIHEVSSSTSALENLAALPTAVGFTIRVYLTKNACLIFNKIRRVSN
jgi:hypothetical protein